MLFSVAALGAVAAAGRLLCAVSEIRTDVGIGAPLGAGASSGARIGAGTLQLESVLAVISRSFLRSWSHVV